MAYRKRAANKGAVGEQVVNWRHNVEKKWATLHFGEMKIETEDKQHVFEVQVYLHELDTHAVRVELYADGINGGDPERLEMQRGSVTAGSSGGYVYRATVPATRPASHYTARIIPHLDGVAVPLEAAQILWYEP
jgi:starch phosphorylase